jgi:hypothetical protein
MMEKGKREALVDRWERECDTSDVGLWWIADDVREALPGDSSEEDVRREALAFIRDLLSRTSVRASDVLPGGEFVPWSGSIGEQLDRIEAAWANLGRQPNIGDVVWFIGRRDRLAKNRPA